MKIKDFENVELISSYSRTQAIEDGVLVDLTHKAKGYYKYPVAFTTALWSLIERLVEDKNNFNDLDGVLHDIFHMSKHGKAISPQETHFKMIITTKGKQKYYTFKVICSPGDDMEPVLTFMKLDED